MLMEVTESYSKEDDDHNEIQRDSEEIHDGGSSCDIKEKVAIRFKVQRKEHKLDTHFLLGHIAPSWCWEKARKFLRRPQTQGTR